MAKQMNCPVCATRGETIAMILKSSYFKCPECGAEIHLNNDGDNSFILRWQEQQSHISRSFQPGTHIVGGGEATGKPKTESMKKKTTSRLNFEACEQRYY